MNSQRVFDRVHGEILLPEIVAKIASTKEFYRLDNIRQLGGCNFVYPSASHTRREHSYGVSYLGGLFATHFKTLYGNVSDDDILCVQIAGLIHDLGHGPFSHLFEEYMLEHDPTWDHEAMGMQLFHQLLKTHPEIDLTSAFVTPVAENLEFIRLMIVGLNRDQAVPQSCGRTAKKRFLLELIHNRWNGLDVDKMDYLARDALAVFGTQGSVPFDRIISAARLNEQSTIMFDERVAFSIVEIYALRARLHRQVYQHRSVLVVEEMLKEVLRSTSLHTKARDPEQFVHLNDSSVLAFATQKLYTRPWMTRLPGSWSMSTLPHCSHCKHVTNYTDKFCTHCGTSTVVRSVARYESKALTDILQFALKEYKIFVAVSDIKFGSEVIIADPHGTSWVDYCPLAKVLFFNRDLLDRGLEYIVKVSPEDMQLPKVRHIRTAYCYVACDATSDFLEKATEAWHQLQTQP